MQLAATKLDNTAWELLPLEQDLWVTKVFPMFYTAGACPPVLTAPLLGWVLGLPLLSTPTFHPQLPFPKSHISLVRWRHFQTGAMMWFGKPLWAIPRTCGFCFWGSNWRKCKSENFTGYRKSPGKSFPSFFFSWYYLLSNFSPIGILKDLYLNHYNDLSIFCSYFSSKTCSLFSVHLPWCVSTALNSEHSYLLPEAPALGVVSPSFEG